MSMEDFENSRMFGPGIPEELEVARRELLAQELVRLGPVRFIEALRVVQQAHKEQKLIPELDSALAERGLVDSTRAPYETMSALSYGYFGDMKEWDQVLSELPHQGEANAS